MSSMLELPPLSLYIHIPWCVRKCPYCDFNSHATGSDLPEDAYVDCLLEDLKQDLHYVQNRPLQSIFFGGGTPSLFSAQAIARILNNVEASIPFADTIEITLEANPGTFEQNKFTGFRRAGINRLSIGIQSFNNLHLQHLGRIHDADEARLAVSSARKAGFDNINLDLMHGLPTQTLDDAMTDLRTAIDLEPTHLSWYQLTIEPNTAFYRQPPVLPSDDILDTIQQAGETLLQQTGFEQYEVSAYAQSNRRSKHNLNYWHFGDYLALGAGAHGKISLARTGQILRYQKTRLPAHYLAAKGRYTASQHAVLDDDIVFEFMLNALRLNEGFSTGEFEHHTGIARGVVEPALADLEQRQLLEIDNQRVKTTTLGRRYLNNVTEAFLPP